MANREPDAGFALMPRDSSERLCLFLILPIQVMGGANESTGLYHYEPPSASTREYLAFKCLVER